MIYSVAMDGPGGAGKSTIAKRIAHKRGIVYVDTGAMYRAIALYLVENSIDVSDEKAVVSALPNIDLKLSYADGAQLVLLNGTDVSGKIRQNEVSMAASTSSAYPKVRAFLLDLQRNMAKKQSVIMDGRDIGTVILPNADVKIFITRSTETRAERRHKELLEKGQTISYEEVLSDIKKRDYQDTHRETAPLKQADDAVFLDTTLMSFDEAVLAVDDIITSKVGE